MEDFWVPWRVLFPVMSEHITVDRCALAEVNIWKMHIDDKMVTQQDSKSLYIFIVNHRQSLI